MHMYVKPFEHVFIFVFLQIFLHAYIFFDTFIYIYICIYIYIHIYTYIYIYIYVYVCSRVTFSRPFPPQMGRGDLHTPPQGGPAHPEGGIYIHYLHTYTGTITIPGGRGDHIYMSVNLRIYIRKHVY